MDNVLQIDKQILNSDKIICRHINNLCNSTRGEISQDILSQLRHFVEHILLKIYANGNDIEDTQDNVKQAVKYAKNQEWLRYLSRFHHFLQVSVSHRTLEEENSERLMLKYYEYLLRIKTMLHDKYAGTDEVIFLHHSTGSDASFNLFTFSIRNSKTDSWVFMLVTHGKAPFLLNGSRVTILNHSQATVDYSQLVVKM